MIKRFILFAAILFSAQFVNAQFDTTFVKTNIRNCADSLVKGFKTRNWELFARYSNPGMIGTMGGTKEFIRYIAGTFAAVPDTAWKVYKTGKVLQVIKTTNELQAVIELHSMIEWQGRRITSTLALIGQSWDGGLFWTFFDSQNDINAARTIKPDLNSAIVIPPKNEKMERIAPSETNKLLSPTPVNNQTKEKTKSN